MHYHCVNKVLMGIVGFPVSLHYSEVVNTHRSDLSTSTCTIWAYNSRFLTLSHDCTNRTLLHTISRLVVCFYTTFAHHICGHILLYFLAPMSLSQPISWLGFAASICTVKTFQLFQTHPANNTDHAAKLGTGHYLSAPPAEMGGGGSSKKIEKGSSKKVWKKAMRHNRHPPHPWSLSRGLHLNFHNHTVYIEKTPQKYNHQPTIIFQGLCNIPVLIVFLFFPFFEL